MLRLRSHLAAPLAVALAAALLTGCSGGDGGGDAEGRGTVIVAVAADADFLLPTVITTLQEKQIVDQLFEPLAAPPAVINTVGDAGYEPRLARSWTWSSDSLQLTLSLDPRARWHDGRPVVAEDVRFSIALLKDPVVASPHASGMEQVDSASVTDSLTAVVWFNRRSPEQFFKLVYNLTIVPAHLLADIPRDKIREAPVARNPVGNGRFRFSRWSPGSLIEVVADTANFRGRPSLDKLIWSISPDPTALLARLVTEEADLVEVLRGPAVAEAAKAPAVRLTPYAGLDYGLALFNQRDPAARATPHPIFRDAAVRRALTMAIDRQAVLKNVFDTLAYLGIGPTVRAQWSSDTAIAMIPHDVAAAKALLDSAGWRDADGDGVREKGGRPLAFALLTPSSSAPRSQSAVLLQAQWKEVGAKVDIDGIEFGAFIERISAGRFDVVMHGLHADPSPADLRENFGTPKSPTSFGKNHSGYSSAVVDAAIDSASTEFDLARAKALYQRAYKQIVDDAAAIFLYEVRLVAGIHKRIDPGPLSPMGWWTTLADWKIAPDQRIARDRVPLGAAANAGAGESTAAPAAK